MPVSQACLSSLSSGVQLCLASWFDSRYYPLTMTSLAGAVLHSCLQPLLQQPVGVHSLDPFAGFRTQLMHPQHCRFNRTISNYFGFPHCRPFLEYCQRPFLSLPIQMYYWYYATVLDGHCQKNALSFKTTVVERNTVFSEQFSWALALRCAEVRCACVCRA